VADQVKKFFAVIALLGLLGGCAEWQAAAAGADSAVVTVAKNAAADALTVNQQLFCTTPYFEVVTASEANPFVGDAFILACGYVHAAGTTVPSNSVTITVPAPGQIPAPVILAAPATK
jgi:hypothetical protein